MSNVSEVFESVEKMIVEYFDFKNNVCDCDKKAFWLTWEKIRLFNYLNELKKSTREVKSSSNFTNKKFWGKSKDSLFFECYESMPNVYYIQGYSLKNTTSSFFGARVSSFEDAMMIEYRCTSLLSSGSAIQKVTSVRENFIDLIVKPFLKEINSRIPEGFVAEKFVYENDVLIIVIECKKETTAGVPCGCEKNKRFK